MPTQNPNTWPKIDQILSKNLGTMEEGGGLVNDAIIVGEGNLEQNLKLDIEASPVSKTDLEKITSPTKCQPNYATRTEATRSRGGPYSIEQSSADDSMIEVDKENNSLMKLQDVEELKVVGIEEEKITNKSIIEPAFVIETDTEEQKKYYGASDQAKKSQNVFRSMHKESTVDEQKENYDMKEVQEYEPTYVMETVPKNRQFLRRHQMKSSVNVSEYIQKESAVDEQKTNCDSEIAQQYAMNGRMNHSQRFINTEKDSICTIPKDIKMQEFVGDQTGNKIAKSLKSKEGLPELRQKKIVISARELVREEVSDEAVKNYTLLCKCIAELVGTYTLVQVGCGGVCVSLYLGFMRGIWQTGVIWLLGATLAIYPTAAISGAHLNPAVTLSMALVRPKEFKLVNVLPYWCAQLLGAILAGALNYVVFFKSILLFEDEVGIKRGSEESIVSASAFGDYYSLNQSVASSFQAVFIEAFGTAFLTFVIFSASSPQNIGVPNALVGALIAVAIGVLNTMLGALTGPAINPARDLGPRLITLVAGWGRVSMTDFWVYIIGPFIGGPFGAAVAEYVIYPSKSHYASF